MMSTSVSVCLSVYEDISVTTRSIFTKFFMHAAYGRGSVLLRQGDEIPRGMGSFGGFLPHWQCIVQHSIWDPFKNGWTDRDAIWDDDEWAWPEEQCVAWGWWSPKEKGQFWGNMCPTSLTSLWIANWTNLCSGLHVIAADAWLQVLDESVTGHEGGGIAHHGRSLISMIS